jgi:hypothetical protein
MKTTVKNLKPGDVFNVSGTVFTQRGENGKTRIAYGDQVSPLVLRDRAQNLGCAKCKIVNVPSDLCILVPLDAKCEVKG